MRQVKDRQIRKSTYFGWDCPFQLISREIYETEFSNICQPNWEAAVKLLFARLKSSSCVKFCKKDGTS